MSLYALNKWPNTYEERYGKNAIYDFLQEQLDRFGFRLVKGETLNVVSYVDRSRPVTKRKIKVAEFRITKIRQPTSKNCGVVYGRPVGESRTYTRKQFAKKFGFMLNNVGHFNRRSFHQP